MAAHVIQAGTPGAVERAVDLLRQGGLVAFPTDTVYGVAAHCFEPAAIARLYEIKGRSSQKAIALLVADPAQVEMVAGEFPPAARRLAGAYWPGALTLVVRRAPALPDVLVGGGETVGVRMPDHPLALRLIGTVGVPLATTSANRSGRSDSISAQDVVRELGSAVDLILDGGNSPGGVPSTVVDLTVDPPAVVRAGPISEDEIRRLL